MWVRITKQGNHGDHSVSELLVSWHSCEDYLLFSWWFGYLFVRSLSLLVISIKDYFEYSGCNLEKEILCLEVTRVKFLKFNCWKNGYKKSIHKQSDNGNYLAANSASTKK